jgi:hypothetical protein
MKKLLVAALFLVLASPAFAAIQNVKVSGDITSTFLDRNDFDLGMTNGLTLTTPTPATIGLKHQNVFITQTRVRIDADLSDNVSTTVGLINERAWDAENNATAGDTNVQLYLASVTMRELLYSPLTVTVGRQVFNYGNGLIMGDGGVNNQASGNLLHIAQDLTERTSYDGVKAILDYKPLTIDMFYFKNQQNVVTGNPYADESSSDVYGINANYQLSDPWSTVAEGYMFSRIDGHNNFAAYYPQNVSTATTTIADKGDTLFVPGLRASTNPIKGLNVQGEVAWQLGNHPVYTNPVIYPGVNARSERRDAMAAQFLASYSVPVLEKYKPTVNAGFTYVSGDRNAIANQSNNPTTAAKSFSAWDPFNEAQGSGTIYNTLFPLSNMYIYTLGASVSPLEDVTASFTWSGLWAAERYNTQNPLYILQPDDSGTLTYNGQNYLAPVTTNKKGLGNEYDVNLSYNYTEDVTFGVSLGWFAPGDAFSKNDRSTASQALADVAVKF